MPIPTKAGEVVYLNSGGSPMTVVTIGSVEAYCVWPGSGGTYPAVCLTTENPEPLLTYKTNRLREQYSTKSSTLPTIISTAPST